MLNEVFPFLAKTIGMCFEFLFSLEINKNPSITLGNFLLACAFIGLIIYFILGTDFIPNLSHATNIKRSSGIKYNNNTDNYQPRHAPGTAGKDYSTRESRHK